MAFPVHQQTQAATPYNGPGQGSLTLSNFNVGAGSDVTLVAYVLATESDEESSVTSVVLDPGVTNQTFTWRGEVHWNYGTTNWLLSELWTLDNPTDITADITATFDNTPRSIQLVVSEYTGANNGIGTSTGAYTGSDGNPTCTFTTDETDSLIVTGHLAQVIDADPFAEGAGAVPRYEPGDYYWIGEKEATGGSDTIEITHDTARRAAMIAVELLAAAAAADEKVPEILVAGRQVLAPRSRL